MAAEWQLPPDAPQRWSIEDQNKFYTLPVQAAEQQAQHIEYFSRWDKKYATIPYEANMGHIMEGVVAERSPIPSQSHRPRNITEPADVAIISQDERLNTARIKRAKAESNYINFLPSFTAFRKNQVPTAVKDISRQISIMNDFFFRDQALHQCRFVYICGMETDDGLLSAVPSGEATPTSAPKSQAFWQTAIQKLGDNSFLDWRNIISACTQATEVIGMHPWENLKARPSENQVVQGKYILTGGGLIYDNLTTDPFVLSNRDIQRDLLNSSFMGMIGPRIAFLQELFDLRLAADGTFPAPEIVEYSEVNGKPSRETIPNPDYAKAPYTVSFIEGHQPFEGIKIGPPPEAFQGEIDFNRVMKLDWSGEIKITDEILLEQTGGKYLTNKYGEYLQLISSFVEGIMPKTTRNIMAILSKRDLRGAYRRIM